MDTQPALCYVQLSTNGQRSVFQLGAGPLSHFRLALRAWAHVQRAAAILTLHRLAMLLLCILGCIVITHQERRKLNAGMNMLLLAL